MKLPRLKIAFPFLIGSTLLMTMFYNCGKAPFDVSQQDEKSLSGSTAASSVTNSSDASIVMPVIMKDFSTVSNDTAVGNCILNFADMAINVSLAAVTQKNCAISCAQNTGKFPLQGITCSHTSGPIASYTSRLGKVCTIESGRRNTTYSVDSATCVQNCAAYGVGLPATAGLKCVYNSKLLYVRPDSQGATPLGSCALLIDDPVYRANVSLSQTTDERCQQTCNLIKSQTGKDGTCTFTALAPQPVVF